MAIALALSAVFNGFVLLVLKGILRVPDKVLEALFTICLPGVLLAGQLVKQNLIAMMALALLINLLLQSLVLFAALRLLKKVFGRLPLVGLVG